MEEEGRIIKIEGNLAQIEIERKSACRTCGLCSMRGKNTMIPSSVILKGALLFYILPLVALILGMALGIKITKHQTGGLILGFSFFISSFVLIWLHSKKTKAQNIYRPKITRIIK
jgi:sigma-E factor negative regulatory protein RseC